MGQMSGMDIEEVKQLGKLMQQTSKQVEDRINAVRDKVQGVQWQGKDRVDFEKDWNRIQKDANHAKEQLEAYGKLALKQAAEQERASSR